MFRNMFKNYSLWVCSLLFLLISITIFWITSNTNWNVANIILNNIASVLIVSGIYNVIYEYFLKANMVELIDEKIKLQREIAKTGITDIKLDIKDINYTTLLKGARKEIDIFHIYGRTWISNNADEIKRILSNKQRKINIRVILLDPQSKFVDGLAEFYDKEVDSLKADMKVVIKEWQKIYEYGKRIKSTSRLRVYYHNCQPSYSIYRFDNTIVSVSNKLSKGRGQHLPSVICKNSDENEDLYAAYIQELTDIISSSKEVDFSNINMCFGDGENK